MPLCVLQMDEPDGFNPTSDSTMHLALAAQKRDYEIVYYTPTQLSLKEGKPVATVTSIQFFDRTENFFECGAAKELDLEKADFILIRQNPPYNMQYLSCTWMLERLSNPIILNNPTNIRNYPEKIFPLDFPDFIPPTCISGDAKTLSEFYKEHQDVVLKPLYGFGGRAISHIQPGATNFDDMLSMLLAEPVILQPYLPEVMTEEKRIILINGKISTAYSRIPPAGDFRANTALGGSIEPTELNAKQIEIAETVGKKCAEKGLFLVGLDTIGDQLIEINVTCPTGLRRAAQLYEKDPAEEFWDAAATL